MLEKTTYGTKLRLLGTSEKVAKYSGMKTNLMLIRTYMTSGICAALSGLLMLGTYASARADYGSQYTLQTILIIVLGGVSPNGGKGKISGVILAIFVLKMLESGINRFQNISSYYISLIWGGVLILAMVMDYFTSDKRTRG
jgi:simple sugar transport system permease protein